MKTLKSKVVCEDINIEDYDKRRHRMKTMEREDLVVSLFFFFFVESYEPPLTSMSSFIFRGHL